MRNALARIVHRQSAMTARPGPICRLSLCRDAPHESSSRARALSLAVCGHVHRSRACLRAHLGAARALSVGHGTGSQNNDKGAGERGGVVLAGQAGRVGIILVLVYVHPMFIA